MLAFQDRVDDLVNYLCTLLFVKTLYNRGSVEEEPKHVIQLLSS